MQMHNSMSFDVCSTGVVLSISNMNMCTYTVSEMSLFESELKNK